MMHGSKGTGQCSMHSESIVIIASYGLTGRC